MKIPYPIYVALVVSTLLTSALFLVSLSPHPLAGKRLTPTSQCGELTNSLNTQD